VGENIGWRSKGPVNSISRREKETEKRGWTAVLDPFPQQKNPAQISKRRRHGGEEGMKAGEKPRSREAVRNRKNREGKTLQKQFLGGRVRVKTAQEAKRVKGDGPKKITAIASLSPRKREGQGDETLKKNATSTAS